MCGRYEGRHWIPSLVRSVWIATFDCSVYSLAVFVTHLSANVGCVDRWLLAGCELVTQDLIVPVHLHRILRCLRRAQTCYASPHD